MILSFHPIFEGDKNIICAGRDPGADDLAAIRSADAVILPQGCRESLYQMARENCSHVFPDYDAKFKYPGKIGQIHLFRKTNAPHPGTETYRTINNLQTTTDRQPTTDNRQLTTPFVFKFDWGGEGENVFLIESQEAFQNVLEKAALFERTGHNGFLIQEYIPSQNRTLRVVVIGRRVISYWRVQENRETFQSSLASGAFIDADSDPDLQAEAGAAVKDFCKKTGINLAGFDFLFSSDSEDKMRTPLFLEINYFFGRQGLGGSEAFYNLLNTEIRKWIEHLN